MTRRPGPMAMTASLILATTTGPMAMTASLIPATTIGTVGRPSSISVSRRSSQAAAGPGGLDAGPVLTGVPVAVKPRP